MISTWEGWSIICGAISSSWSGHGCRESNPDMFGSTRSRVALSTPKSRVKY